MELSSRVDFAPLLSGAPETMRNFWKQWIERLSFLVLSQKTELPACRWIILTIEAEMCSGLHIYLFFSCITQYVLFLQ